MIPHNNRSMISGLLSEAVLYRNENKNIDIVFDEISGAFTVIVHGKYSDHELTVKKTNQGIQLKSTSSWEDDQGKTSKNTDEISLTTSIEDYLRAKIKLFECLLKGFYK